MKKLIIILLSVVFIFSCNKKPIKSIGELFESKSSYSLFGIKVPVDILFLPRGIDFNDDFFILQAANNDKFFYVYDAKNYNFINSFLKYGNGPNEVNFVADFHLKKDNRLYLNTLNGKYDIIEYDLTKISSDTSLSPINTTKLEDILSEKSFFNLIYSKNNFAVGRYSNNQNKLNKLLYYKNLKTQKDTFLIDVPFIDKLSVVNDVMLNSLFQGSSCISDDEKYVFFSSKTSEVLYFLKINDNDIKVIQQYELNPPIFNVVGNRFSYNENTVWYVGSMSFYKDKLYAVYYNDNIQNISNRKKNTSQKWDILVFNELGKALYTIKIDKFPWKIKIFGKKMIVLSEDELGNYCLYQYDLSKI